MQWVERPILYTDTLQGVQVCSDDMWAITTKERDALRSDNAMMTGQIMALRAENARLMEALQSYVTGDVTAHDGAHKPSHVARFNAARAALQSPAGEGKS